MQDMTLKVKTSEVESDLERFTNSKMNMVLNYLS